MDKYYTDLSPELINLCKQFNIQSNSSDHRIIYRPFFRIKNSKYFGFDTFLRSHKLTKLTLAEYKLMLPIYYKKQTFKEL